MAEAAQVRVTAHAEPVRLLADADRLLQMLTNLLSNAIKFSPPGALVDVVVERDDHLARFRVCDHGRGIPSDKLASIFGRFEQVDASDSREKGGTGLGLAICRSIVEQHGGRMWAESTLGQGSTFHVLLPLRPASDLPRTPEQPAGQAGRGPAGR